MATIGLCGFECQSAGTTQHAWNNSAAPTYSTGVYEPGGGGTSLTRVYAGAANDCGVMPLAIGAAQYWVGRFAIRVDSLGSSGVVALFSGTGGNVYLGYDPTADTFMVWTNGNYASRQASTTTVADATWCWIDVRINGTSRDFEWKIDGTSQTTKVLEGATSTFNGYVLLGSGSSDGVGSHPASGTVYYDSLAVSQTSGDYPLVYTGIKGFVPSADGTHNTGDAGNFTNAAGTNITNATTDAWTYLDEVPPTTTDRVEQRLRAPAASTYYVEVRFDSTAETRTPIAVDFLASWRTATAANAAGDIRMRDNLGATDDAIVSGTINSVSDVYVTKHYAARPAALGAWTAGAIADLRARVGFGSDVTPDIWFGGIVAEAALQAEPSYWPGRRAPTSVLQAVNRAGSF